MALVSRAAAEVTTVWATVTEAPDTGVKVLNTTSAAATSAAASSAQPTITTTFNAAQVSFSHSFKSRQHRIHNHTYDERVMSHVMAHVVVHSCLQSVQSGMQVHASHSIPFLDHELGTCIQKTSNCPRDINPSHAKHHCTHPHLFRTPL